MAFHPDDVAYAERALADVDLHGLIPQVDPSAPVALCLHAGNLPFVGWHDVVSVVRAGYRYAGKLSRKDPHLATWIRGWMPAARISVELGDFNGLKADVVLFSGSEASVGPVMSRLRELDAVTPATRYLIRTAHTSLAWVDSLDPGTMAALADGIARFDGNGCRSVRYVYSPFSLEEAKSRLIEAAGAFADRNTDARNRYREAFYRSIGKESVRVGRMIVTDSDPLWDDDGLVVWHQGTRQEMMAHAERLGGALQQVYHTKEIMVGGRWEPLSQAQRPGVDWKPDGLDTMAFLRSSR